MTIIYELFTIAAAFLLCVSSLVSVSLLARKSTEQIEPSWHLNADRIGVLPSKQKNRIFPGKWKDEIDLGEGNYWIGTRATDEIYLDTTDKIRAYLNVQRDNVYLTAIKGKVCVDNVIYEPDRTSRICLSDGSVVQLSDIEFQFMKAR